VLIVTARRNGSGCWLAGKRDPAGSRSELVAVDGGLWSATEGWLIRSCCSLVCDVTAKDSEERKTL